MPKIHSNSTNKTIFETELLCSVFVSHEFVSLERHCKFKDKNPIKRD